MRRAGPKSAPLFSLSHTAPPVVSPSLEVTAKVRLRLRNGYPLGYMVSSTIKNFDTGIEFPTLPVIYGAAAGSMLTIVMSKISVAFGPM